jgi:cell division protein FtsL
VTPAGATAAARRAAAGRRPVRARGRAATAPAAPRVVPRVPRRVSGPARGRQLRRGRATLGARALAGLRALPDHGIVERLTRGRLWIGLIGCLLLGLVSMQVALLKLNAGIGRAVQQGANLERRNGELRAQISRLGSEERIQAMGAKLGLIMPDAGHVTYLSVRPGQDAAAALQALRANHLGASAAPPAQSQTPAPSTDQSGTGSPTDQSAPSTDQSAPSTDQSTPSTDQSTPTGSPTDQSGSGDQAAAGAPATADPSAAGAGGTGTQG